MQEERLLAYLKASCRGKAHRICGKEIERELHISGTDLRKLVNRLRCKGTPIASDQYGYYYAVTAGEVYATIRQLRRMVMGLEAAIAGLERALGRFAAEGGDDNG